MPDQPCWLPPCWLQDSGAVPEEAPPTWLVLVRHAHGAGCTLSTLTELCRVCMQAQQLQRLQWCSPQFSPSPGAALQLLQALNLTDTPAGSGSLGTVHVCNAWVVKAIRLGGADVRQAAWRVRLARLPQPRTTSQHLPLVPCSEHAWRLW